MYSVLLEKISLLTFFSEMMFSAFISIWVYHNIVEWEEDAKISSQATAQ